MSQEALARMVGVSRVTITDWENSKTELKSQYIIALCGSLNVAIEWLLTGKELIAPPQIRSGGKIDMVKFTECYKLFNDAVLVAGNTYTNEIKAECLIEMYHAALYGGSPAAAMLRFLTSL